MSTETQTPLAAETTWYPGEVVWTQGSGEAQPLTIRQGVVAYRSGAVAVGLVGPGQVAMPVPGVPGSGPAACDLVAITETTALPWSPDSRPLDDEDLRRNVEAVVTGAGRLGNMSLPQRLAALLLDITEMTGQPVVGCRQDILAMAAAARRETVATILSSWRDEEWIQTRYRRCKVVDREALERIRSGEM